jgi:O-antigen ligase
MISESRPQALPPDQGQIRGSSVSTTARAVKPLVCLAFYAFVFSLPFETVDLGAPVELTTITGCLLILAALFQPLVCFRLPSASFGCFALYLQVWFILGLLQSSTYRGELVGHFIVFLQLLVMAWIAYNLMRHDRVARTALLMLGLACGLLGLLQFSGITARASDVGSQVERVTALGFHPNKIGRILALGLLALIGLNYGGGKATIRPACLAWPLFALVGITLVQTGSRGSLLALAAGLAAFMLRGGSLSTRVRNLLVVLLGLGFFTWLSYTSETTRARFEETLESGDTARRDQIYPTAWQMFVEKPLAGWGPVASEYELGARLRHPDEPKKNPHNLVLYLLTTTGLLGSIPMLLGIGLTLRAGWKARGGPHGILPLAMLIALLVANMSGLWLFNKLHWLVMAYALASGSRVFTRPTRTILPASQAL